MRWKLESQRDEFGKALVDVGRKNHNVVVTSADLTASTKLLLFSREYPGRFFNFGVAEQNMMGASAGLALSGKIVFAATFAVFASGRAYDQVRQSIAYTRANVKIIATHSGITVGGDGASHQATEDIALMRVLPNMTVIVPCDARETVSVVNKVVDNPSPMYIRLNRPKVPTITDSNYEFQLGKASVLKDGADVTLIGTGIMVSRCLLASEILAKKGVSARVINMSTIKPIDEETILRCAKETNGIVTAEDHSIIGGLGSGVSEVLSEKRPTIMRRIGIRDTFGESGSIDDLMIKYRLTENDIVKAVEDIVSCE